LDRPKHGVHPSAVWIAWIRSVLFILPGVIPSPCAFFLISGILTGFCATFVAAIFCFSFYSGIYFYKYFVLQSTHFYSSSAKHHLIYFVLFRLKVEKKSAFLRTFAIFFANFCALAPIGAQLKAVLNKDVP
jgi:hypothetical protein